MDIKSFLSVSYDGTFLLKEKFGWKILFPFGLKLDMDENWLAAARAHLDQCIYKTMFSFGKIGENFLL